jgi:hypothetical protein
MTPDLKRKIQQARVLLSELHFQLDEETTQVRARADLNETVHHFVDLREMQGTLKDMKDNWTKIHDFLSRDVIPEIFVQYRAQTGFAPPYRIDGVGRVGVSYKWNASMLDKTAGKQWLRDNGAGALVIETVNAQSLASFAKDLAENYNKELPHNIFKSGKNPYTSISEKEDGNGK